MPPSVDSICTLLVRTRLLSAEDVQKLKERWLREAGPATADAAAFGKWLVANEYVTAYQADRLMRGQTDHYFFNQYKLLDRLGMGAMAGIYKATHRLGQVVAIKVLPPTRAKDPVSLSRFQREAKLAMRLKHPNIVRTFQTGTSSNLHYLVMEYLDGETLEDVLKRRGKLPPGEAARLLYQALMGLQQIHEQGMVHRDLKPANLMLVPAASEPDHTLYATLKILDIGLGRALFQEEEPETAAKQELTAAGDMLGSPDYMAPEQARDAHAADIRADIYGLGCVMYRMLTGQPPFPDTNLVRQIMRHARDTPRPLKDFDPALPDAMQTILNQMLAKDPAKRFATPGQAALAVQAFLNREANTAFTANAAQPVPQSLQAYESWLSAEDPDATIDYRPPDEGPAASRSAVRVGPRSSSTAGQPKVPVARPYRSFWGRHGVKVLAGIGVVVFGLMCWLSVELFKGYRGRSPTPVDVPHTETPARPSLAGWLEKVAALPPDEQVQEVAAQLKERNPNFNGQVQHTVRDGVVLELELVTDEVTDIAPLTALPRLKRLSCAGSGPGRGKLADLAPLGGMALEVLDCSANRVRNLAPLKKMPLIFLNIAGTPVRDLEPLTAAPLVVLNCTATNVNDLSPLRGKALTVLELDADNSRIDDLAPLEGMPLQTLWCNYQPERDARLLCSLTKLTELNGKPAAEIRKVAEAQEKSLDTWVKQTTKLLPDKQLEAVRERLKQHNPGFDGTIKHKLQGSAIVEVQFDCDQVSDLSPLRALPGLKRLFCPGSGPGKGKLAGLHSLKGLKLTELDCGWSQVRDLTPLKGMPLTHLSIDGNPGLSDLTPLQGMPLTYLKLNGCSAVADLAPLRNSKLTALHVAETQVRDLTPLRTLKLASLTVHHTPVIDLSPLKGSALKTISCDFKPLRDAAILRAMASLDRINNKPAAEFWKEVDARQQALEAFVKQVAGLPVEDQVKAVAAELQKRNPNFDGTILPRVRPGAVTEVTLQADHITDLTPLAALPGLTRVTCTGSAPGKGKLDDLWPLKPLASLRGLVIANTAVSDLSPLQGKALEDLDIADTLVDDLSVLQKMPLSRLNLTHTPVEDLSPLAGLPLRDVKGDFQPDDLDMLHGIKTLVTINDKSQQEARKLAVAKPRADRPNAKTPRDRTPATTHFSAKLVKVSSSEKTLTVQIAQQITVQDPKQLANIMQRQIQLAEAAATRNPMQRMKQMQEHMGWIAYYRSQLYTRREQNQQVELTAAEDVKVRVAQMPKLFNEKGEPRKPTPEDEKRLKGDPKLPGYQASFNDLKPQQPVEVFLAAATTSLPAEAKGVDARLRVVMIVIGQ